MDMKLVVQVVVQIGMEDTDTLATALSLAAQCIDQATAGIVLKVLRPEDKTCDCRQVIRNHQWPAPEDCHC